MSASFDRFLNARRPFSRKASLGRAFAVVRQSWLLTDDPRATPPEVEACAPLYVAAASPEPLKLHPLAMPSVVSPALASCYAQYRLAAGLSNPEEAGDLNANADRARQLALKGKEGTARAAAEAAPRARTSP